LPHPASFSNEIEWIYWELWHHEGRRARQGASMMGPDYTWWHGIYEVAHNFYFKFLPELDNIADPAAQAYRDSLLLNDPLHRWLSRNTADLKSDIRSGKMREMYKRFYNPGR
ncbi:MAG: hypothetical protein V2A61_02630, partial [Calditrichota bacterium]